MLRAAAKTQVQQGLRTYSSVVTKKKSGGGKLLALTGVAVAGAGGVVGYAYVDPAFRQQVESQVPQLKPVFEQILGDASLDKTQKELGDKVTQIKESILPSKKAADDDVPAPLVKLPPIEKKAAVNVDAVDVRKDVTPLPKPTPQQAKQLNKQLEDRLMSAIQSAESRVKVATDAKIRTIEAVNQHAAQLKQTVDDAHNADWEKVTVALQKAEGFSRGDGQAETDGRNYIDSLKKIITDGRANPATAQNPLLLNANETANKLNHQLDELNGLVSKARQESQILCQYKDLIDRSRQQFALELKSILPNVDVHAKEQTLNEEELNALIAHAHLRVDQLRRQLADQQLREEQHIARAIEEQRKADEQLAKEQLDREVERVRQQQEIDVERQVMNSRSSMQTELESQLKRTTSAHAEHLEQVIRTQRQLFEIEHSQKVEEAILSEREAHSRHIGVAVSKLEGIEHALTERTALDAENRRAKQFWIACHNLIDTIKHGNRSSSDMEQRRVPLADSLATLQQVNPDDAFVKSIAAAFPKDVVSKGAYSEDDIKKRFDKVYSTGRSVARIDGSGETTLTQYAWSWVRSAFLVELPRSYSDRDAIDPASIDNIEVLSRAKWFVERGDFEKAIKLSHLLKGEPALLAQGWIEDARHHIESRLLAQMLVAHAAVSSIRSTY